jgi:hypothetical protein
MVSILMQLATRSLLELSTLLSQNERAIQGYIGTDDVFLPGARRLRDLVRAAGGRIDLYETEGGFHVFMLATFMPEAKRVFRQIAQDLGSQ